MMGLHTNWNKDQRIRIKLIICALGILILLLILMGRGKNGQKEPFEPETGEPIHIPVVENIKNVWIMEVEEQGLAVFRDGQKERYVYQEEAENEVWSKEYVLQQRENLREQVADITLTDGRITNIRVKTEKISGKILSADDSGVVLEERGKLEFTDDYKGYRVYQTLSMCTYRDIMFGYDYTDLVMDDGKICAFLLAREEAMENIRVLIKSSDFAGMEHEMITLTADTDFVIDYQNEKGEKEQEKHTAGEVVNFEKESTYFSGERVTVKTDAVTGKISLLSVNRAQGTPRVRGDIEMTATENGIIMVNELPLEEYLYCVVPSEMPASYPMEALKAQAICARTYAYGHMRAAGYPQYGAHVDDSTSYQVYNNILEQESTTTAVKETYGQLLYTEQGQCADTFYYSTSCGFGSDLNVWRTSRSSPADYITAKGINRSNMEYTDQDSAKKESEILTGEQMAGEEIFREFISHKNTDDFEAGEKWYRWTYEVPRIDVKHLWETVVKRYEANENMVLTLQKGEYVSKPISEFSEIKSISVAKRNAGGVADELVIETDKGTFKVITEYNIRYILNDGIHKVKCQDGNMVASPNLLPSAFFVIDVVQNEESVVGYTLNGGGYGHGVGMSQNGAKAMAMDGYTADDILHFFYEGCSVQNIYGE